MSLLNFIQSPYEKNGIRQVKFYSVRISVWFGKCSGGEFNRDRYEWAHEIVDDNTPLEARLHKPRPMKEDGHTNYSLNGCFINVPTDGPDCNSPHKCGHGSRRKIEVLVTAENGSLDGKKKKDKKKGDRKAGYLKKNGNRQFSGGRHWDPP